MSIRYNLFGQIEPANVYLCKPKQGISYALNGIDRNSFSYTTALQDIDSITFNVDRYIDVDGEQIESNGYNDLDYLMEVLIDDIGTFIIDTPPTTNKDTDKEYKEVSAKSCEWEMLSKDLVAFKVNTGEDTSVERLIDNNINFTGLTIEYVRVYDKDRAEYSLIDIIIKEKLPDWSVGYVSEDIAKKTPYFNIDSTNVYAFFTQDMAKYLQCIFKFDAVNRKINVYSADEIGEDTNINISDKNLLQQLSIEPQTEEIYTRYKIFGNDELDIRQVNFGSDTIEDITYYLTTKYMPQELIDKYKTYAEYKENKRSDYIDKSKKYVTTLEVRDELINRLPLDALNYDWDSFNEDELKEELGYFQGLVNVILQNLVDVGFEATNLPIVREFVNNHKTTNELNKYKEELHLYVHNIDILIDSYISSPNEKALENIIINIATIASSTDLQRMINGTFTWFNGITYSTLQDSMYWWDYVSYTTSIIPNIDTALDNLYLTDDNKIDYDESWKTNWELYGTNELKAQIELYKNKMETLVDYSEPWESLSQEKRLEYTGEQPYKDLHNDYVEAQNNFNNATAKYNELMAMVNAYNVDLEKIQSSLSSIANDVSIKNESFGFTEKELSILGSFYIDAEYTNENFLVTEYTTSIEKVDIELELLDYAKEDIAKQSRPQYHFSCDIDNLFAIAEYQCWHDSLSNGNFIWISLDGFNYEKVRIVSITRNPMLPNDSELEVEFSNMLVWNGQRSDLTDLFDNAMSSTSNEISRGSLSSGSGSTEVSNELIRYILNSRPMAQSMEAINLQQEVINQKTFKVIAENITLSSSQIILDGDTTVMPGFTLSADNMDVNSIFAKTITATGTIKGGTIDGAKIIANNGNIGGWTIGGSLYKTVYNVEDSEEIVSDSSESTSSSTTKYYTYQYIMQAPNGTSNSSFLLAQRKEQNGKFSTSSNGSIIEGIYKGDYYSSTFKVDYLGKLNCSSAVVGSTDCVWRITSGNISVWNHIPNYDYKEDKTIEEATAKYYSIQLHTPFTQVDSNKKRIGGYETIFSVIQSTNSEFKSGNKTIISWDKNGTLQTYGNIYAGNTNVDSQSLVNVRNSKRSGHLTVTGGSDADGTLGIYDSTNNKWMICSYPSQNILINGNTTVSGTLDTGVVTITKGTFGLLKLNRTDSANAAALTFANTNGDLGSICMRGSVNTGLFRQQNINGTSTYYQFIDEGITNWNCSGTIKAKKVNPTATTSSDSTTYSVGTSSLRWGYVYTYATNITTSDRNLKHHINYEEIDSFDVLFDALKPCTYFMKNGSRKHMGFIAQDVEKAMKLNGLTIDDLSFVCRDIEYKLIDETLSDDENNREYLYDENGNFKYIYGLKYTELHALEINQIQKLKNKIKELEKEIELLKSNK